MMPVPPVVAGRAQERHAERQETGEGHGQDSGPVVEIFAQCRPIDWNVEQARKNEGQPNPFMDLHNAWKSDVKKQKKAGDQRRDKRQSRRYGYARAISGEWYHRSPPVKLFVKTHGRGSTLPVADMFAEKIEKYEKV
jgi:hypothetical protein